MNVVVIIWYTNWSSGTVTVTVESLYSIAIGNEIKICNKIISLNPD